MHDSLKAAAREALTLFPPTPVRESFLAEINEGQPGADRTAHVTRVISPAPADEEWSEVTRFVEIVYQSGVLTFSAYDNYATVIGATQRYDCRVCSTEPVTAESEALLAKWLAEWRELMATRNSLYGASIY